MDSKVLGWLRSIGFIKAIPRPIRQFIKNQVFIPWKRYYERKLADRRLLKTSPVEFTIKGMPLSDIPGLLLCTGTGLYLICDGQIRQLLTGWFFGLSRKGTKYYVYQNLDISGRILTFLFENGKITNLHLCVNETPRTIHQIDFFDNHVFATDPANNKVDIYTIDGKLANALYPFGKLENGKMSPNYAHINSVFAHKDQIYVVAHNYTQHSGRKSDLLVLDRSTYNILAIQRNIGSCAHNTIIYNNHFLICDSLDGSLLNHGEKVFQAGQFTRGLAMNDNLIVLGGSMYGKMAERLGKDCFLFFLSHQYELLSTLTLKNIGPCFEVRLVEKDYGLSLNGFFR